MSWSQKNWIGSALPKICMYICMKICLPKCKRYSKMSHMKAKKKAVRKTNPTARVKEDAAIYHPAMKVAAPPAIEKIAEKFGLRQETLSRMTGFSLRAVAGWS